MYGSKNGHYSVFFFLFLPQRQAGRPIFGQAAVERSDHQSARLQRGPHHHALRAALSRLPKARC